MRCLNCGNWFCVGNCWCFKCGLAPCRCAAVQPVIAPQSPVQSITWVTKLSDEDIDKIAKRVLELLRNALLAEEK